MQAGIFAHLSISIYLVPTTVPSTKIFVNNNKGFLSPDCQTNYSKAPKSSRIKADVMLEKMIKSVKGLKKGKHRVDKHMESNTDSMCPRVPFIHLLLLSKQFKTITHM